MMTSALTIAAFLSGAGWLAFAVDLLLLWRHLGAHSWDRKVRKASEGGSIGTPMLALLAILLGVGCLKEAYQGVSYFDHLTPLKAMPAVCLLLIQVIGFLLMGLLNLCKPARAFRGLRSRGYDMRPGSQADKDYVFVEGVVYLSLGTLTGAAWLSVVVLSILG